jgi:SAM-dependent methyltransferase
MSPEMQGAQAYYDWLSGVFSPHCGRRVLEIGPGFGDMAERLGAQVESYVGLDESQDVIDRLRERFKRRANFNFIADKRFGGDSEALLKEQNIDTVFAANLLEHLPEEAPALRQWARISPGGRLLLLVPAHPSLYGSLDDQAGHYRRYTRSGLRALLDREGVSVSELRYFNALGALGWFLAARLLRLDLGGSGTGRMIKLYDRWVLPASRLLDPVLGRLWGQSLLAIGRLPVSVPR